MKVNPFNDNMGEKKFIVALGYFSSLDKPCCLGGLTVPVCSAGNFFSTLGLLTHRRTLHQSLSLANSLSFFFSSKSSVLPTHSHQSEKSKLCLSISLFYFHAWYLPHFVITCFGLMFTFCLSVSVWTYKTVMQSVLYCTLHFSLSMFWRSLLGNACKCTLVILTTMYHCMVL